MGSPALSLVNKALDRAMRSFVQSLGLRYDHVGLNRFLPKDQRSAIEYFSGLGEDYTQEFQFRDKAGTVRATSTARLLKFQSTSYQATRLAIQRKLADLARDGFVSYTNPWGSSLPAIHPSTGRNMVGYYTGGRSTWDSRLLSPQEFLRWPSRGYPHACRDSDVGELCPRVRLSTMRQVWITPKALNPTLFRDDSFMNTLSVLWNEIIELHRCANANALWSPALSHGMGWPENPLVKHTFQEDGNGGNYAILRGIKSSSQEWRNLYKAGIKQFATFDDSMNTASPASVQLQYMSSDPIWRQSLSIRQAADRGPTFPPLGERGLIDRPFNLDFADCTVDLQECVQLAQFLTDMPPQALLHSCLCYHEYLLQNAFQQLGLHMFSDLAGYQARMDQEASARQDKALSNGIAAAGAVGLIIGSAGHADTTNSISGATVASTELAMAVATGAALGGVAGVVGAVALMGIAFLVGWLTSDRAPRLRPDKLYVKDRPLVANGWDTNMHFHRTCEGAIQSIPVIRYGAQDA